MNGGLIGMLVVETIAKIRRLHLVQGKSIKAICRELRHVAENGAQGAALGRDGVSLSSGRVQPLPKLGAWQGELDRLLTANAARAPAASG